MIQVSDTISFDNFCSTFSLTTYSEVVERYSDSVSEAAQEVSREFEPCSPEWEAAYDSAMDYLWGDINRAYNGALKAAFDYLSNTCEISVSVDLENQKVTFESEDWNKAAEVVIESINGYGSFHFEDSEELILSGPYAGAKEATIAHLHWHSERGNIFGEEGIKKIFDSSFQRYLR
jgi:hypothetical protein